MTVLLNNIPALDPTALARDCSALAIRTDSWLGRANSYRCADGPLPGEAVVLMSLSALCRLDPAGTLPDTYDLEFSIGDQSGYTTRTRFPGLVATDCQCVTPGARGDEAAYLLTLADRRHTDAKVIADVAFGMRHKFAGHDLTNADTWQAAASHLWGLMSLPGDEELPVVPTQIPEDLEYWQTPALFALDDLVGRIGCRLIYDPVAEEYRFVIAGEIDAAFVASVASHNIRRIWDNYSRPPARGRVPRTVRTLFAKLPHTRGLDGSPWYAVDQSDPAPTSRPWSADAPTGVELLHDDLAAEYDAFGALSNESALIARALDRTSAYYTELAALLDDQRLVFAGSLSDAGLLPGSLVSATIWSDLGVRELPGRGVITEVVRRGTPLNPNFNPRTIDPLTELVRLTGSTTTGPGGITLHDAWVQRWEPGAGLWVDRQQVWIVDANEG